MKIVHAHTVYINYIVCKLYISNCRPYRTDSRLYVHVHTLNIVGVFYVHTVQSDCLLNHDITVRCIQVGLLASGRWMAPLSYSRKVYKSYMYTDAHQFGVSPPDVLECQPYTQKLSIHIYVCTCTFTTYFSIRIFNGGVILLNKYALNKLNCLLIKE